MAESDKHIILVKNLFLWVKDNIFKGECGNIYVDLPEMTSQNKPPKLSAGVRPDLHALRREDNLFIIGEAKTSSDIETRHSIMQYNYYIDECEQHQGPAMIVIAVPWFSVRLAANLFECLKERKNASKTQIKVIERLPG